ncbi:MAG: putative transrane protein [Gammaproteobacteria bacterium]|nr:putative transrane protein [Gammaproteobacteria bacterium]
MDKPAQPLHFTGSGSEYFGIWIVNLLLTIVTLGVYSAWAKVRRLQYFYRHTELAGSTFDFHGSPRRILIGRAIALLMLIAYQYSVRLRSPLTLVILACIAVVMPWLLRNSFRFRLYNTSWRGTRFHFRGSLGGAYRVFLLNGFLTLITLYVMAPFMHQRLKAYQHDNTWFGRTRCSFHARAGQFYAIYLLLLATMVVLAIVIGFSGIGGALAALSRVQKQGGHANPAAVFRTLAMLYGVLILIGVSIGPAFHAFITNLVWNNTRVGEHRIECRMSPVALIWITVSNFVLVVLTVGLFVPWAMVRLARFQLESVRLLPAGDLQEFVAAEPESLGAVGEEAATAFDFDISL